METDGDQTGNHHAYSGRTRLRWSLAVVDHSAHRIGSLHARVYADGFRLRGDRFQRRFKQLFYGPDSDSPSGDDATISKTGIEKVYIERTAHDVTDIRSNGDQAGLGKFDGDGQADCIVYRYGRNVHHDG